MKNELGFVWFGGAARVFFFLPTLTLCLVITWPLDLKIE